MVVLEVEADYVHLVDGKLRTLAKPKKKKKKHVQPTCYTIDITAPQRGLQDADIRKGLAQYTGPK